MNWLGWVSCDRRLRRIWLVIFIVALGALAVRAPRLRIRPMHTDEAVHAEKFGKLLEDGVYTYDPNEYHGPTLNYLTLIPAWLSGAGHYAEISEITVRIVPVIFGVLLILMTALLADGLGPSTIPSAILAALSPAMVFYSRYYIQEMLLICFTFGVIVSGYRYARSRSLPWALAAGLSIGLMHASKETAVVALCSMGVALALVTAVPRREGRTVQQALAGVNPLHLVLGAVAAIGISALFYSSFLSHPRGVLDSYLTYRVYLGRGAGGDATHIHPWYYYLQMLLFSRYGGGPIWTEGGIVLLALVGIVAAAKGGPVGTIDPRLLRFIAIYTLAMTAVYSALPYKTPWCVLGLLHGMTLLAGAGVAALLTWMKKAALRAVVAGLVIAAAIHLAFQAYQANFVYHSDSRNPYVYAHPTTEILIVAEAIEEYAGVNGLGCSEDKRIQVAVPDNDYWPLPWYLRAYHVGWCLSLPEEIGPLILISDKLEDALVRRLYVETPPERRQMYMYLFDEPYYVWARPGVKLLGFVRKDLWDARAQGSDRADAIEGSRGR